MSSITPDYVSGPERGTAHRRFYPSEHEHGPKTRTNVGPAERIGSVAAGGLAAAAGVGLLLQRKSVAGGLALLGAGVAIGMRGLTGHCSGYEALGVSEEPRMFSNPFSRGISFTHAVTIQKPVNEVYEFYRDFTNLPRVMKGLRAVEKLDAEGRHTRWIANAPMGMDAQWTAVMTEDQPNRRIAWESEESSLVSTRGWVAFEEKAGGRGTVLRAHFEYRPLGGVLATAMAKAFGQSPRGHVRMDLRRLKAYLEAGEVPSTEGQSRGTCSG